MANVRKDVIGPDGKQGTKGRELIALVKEVPEKDGKVGYYMNCQLAQYKANAKNLQSQPQLALGHEFGEGDNKKKSYDMRITQNQFEALKANAKCADASDDKSNKTVLGFTADLLTTKEHGLMPKIETAKPTTYKNFGADCWKKQNAATAKAFKAGQAAREAAKSAQAEVATPAVEEEAVPEA